MNTYILIDSALIESADKIPLLADDVRPSWIVPIYEERAYVVSPLLIDVEAACDAEAIEPMMTLVNACWPQLHASLIETDLDHLKLAEHLRRFIYVTVEESEELTLRFADSAVLPALALHFSPGQWKALTGPIARWRVHARDHSLKILPASAPDIGPAATPLSLTFAQVAALNDAMGTARLLANLRQVHPGRRFAASPMQEYQWADQARAMWRAAGHEDNMLLLTFLEGVFDTNGKILRVLNMPELLADPDPEKVNDNIRRAVAPNLPLEGRNNAV